LWDEGAQVWGVAKDALSPLAGGGGWSVGGRGDNGGGLRKQFGNCAPLLSEE
jgi:hypothetical protein